MLKEIVINILNMSAMDNANTNTQDKYETFDKWDDDNLEIDPKILRGIYAFGFEDPSPIQKKSIIPLIKKHDVIGQAQSGTGKTGAFTVGALSAVDKEINSTQVLILTPTHELSQQNKSVADGIGTFCGFRTHLLIGGTHMDEDREILTNPQKVPHIIVGCPGRVHDMMRREWLNTSKITLVVLDEADEMLSSCFKEQVYNIIQYLPGTVQVALFSATMPDDVKELADKFMRDPVKILVDADMLTLEGIKQYYVAVEDDQNKYEVLKDIFHNISFSQTIIYCNSVKRVEDLHDAMKMDNFPVICIHSNMTHDERSNSIKQFRSGQHRVLISSDITARGIDVQQVSVVINFDIPKNKHKYIHRIGRSGRWGRKGLAINFLTKRDTFNMKEIESWYHTQIEELPSNYADVIKTS